MNVVEIIIAILGSLGGFELIKWFYTRKSKERLAKAEADIEGIKANKEEFYYLKERIEFKEKELLEKERRFVEQTDLVRKLNSQLIDKEVEIGNYKAKISELKTERALKLCQVRGCPNREPQSGY